MKTLIFSTLLLFFSTILLSQGVYIEVVDKITKDPIPFAHVCFESLDGKFNQYEITNVDGKVVNNIKSESKVAVTYMGYNLFESTVSPDEPMQILLEPTVFGVDEVVVTGQYEPQRVDKSIYKIEVIGAKKIEEKGANNLAELLNGESNIQITQDGVLGSSLKMQGLSGENVKILINGVPIIGRMDGNLDLGQIDLSNVDHIEIVEGPMSVIYGSNAIAGTINIITKENTRRKLLTSINSYYETVGVYNVDGNASVTRNNHTISFAGGRNFFAGYSFIDSLRTPTYKPKEQYKANIDYIYNHKKFKLKLNSIYFDEELMHLGNVEKSTTYVRAFDQYFYTNRLSNSIQLNAKISNDKFIEFLGAYSIYSRIKNTYAKDFTDLSQQLLNDASGHDTTTFENIMMRGYMSKSEKGETNKFNYQVGFDINIDDGTGKRITDSVNTRIGDYAAFISTKWHATKNISFQPGIRYIHNTKFEAPIIPSLNVKFQLFDKFNIRASYAKGFRAPSLKEMYLNFVDANHNIHGNTDLQAETNNSFNFSVKYNIDTIKHNIGLELSSFYNDGKNVIDLVVIDPEQLYYRNENIEKRKTIGGRFNVNYSLHPRFNIKAGFAVTGYSEQLSLPSIDSSFVDDMWIHEDSTFMGDFRYKTDFNCNISYKILALDLLVSAYYKYNGMSTDLYVSFNPDTDQEYLERLEVDPYHMLDISLTKKFLNDRLNFVLGAKNIFNVEEIPARTVVADYGYNTIKGWGTTYFIKMSYKFSK